MSAQTLVPTSTTDCRNSGLIWPPSVGRPASSIWLTWERSSYVFPSRSWNSSSMPIVNVGCIFDLRGPRFPATTSIHRPWRSGAQDKGGHGGSTAGGDVEQGGAGDARQDAL